MTTRLARDPLAALVLALLAATLVGEPDAAPSTRSASAVDAKGTLKGTVAAALRPAVGAITSVRAISARDGTAAAGGRVSRNGAYRLSVPPGVYLVLVEKTSRGASTTGFGRLALVRGGKTSAVPRVDPGSATARRTTSNVTGRNGAVSSGGSAAAKATRPAIATRYLTGSGPNGTSLGRAMANQLLPELVGSPCYVVVEWEQRGAILDEIRLQQSRYFDPATRLTPRLIQPTNFVEGSVATTRSAFSWDIRARERSTGRILASDSGSASSLDAIDGIARRLREQLEEELCGLPARFSGTFSGENRTAARNTYSGTISFIRARDAGGVVSYRLERVAWTHRISSLPGSPCQVNATTRVNITKPSGQNLGVLVIQKQKIAKGYGYAITASFASPRQLRITFVCNGVPSEQPWVPGGALNTGPPGTGLTGQGRFTDGETLKGRYESAGTASTYTWDLKGSG